MMPRGVPHPHVMRRGRHGAFDDEPIHDQTFGYEDTDPMNRLLVVVPAYNEEASIRPVLIDIRAAVPDAGVLVVDDGSSDRTREIALAQGADVLSLPFNLGVGGAMRAGFRFAVRHGYTQVIQVDADGQHDPTQIPMLVGELAEADIVIGARFAGTGAYPVRGPRRWAMRTLAFHLSTAYRSTID